MNPKLFVPSNGNRCPLQAGLYRLRFQCHLSTVIIPAMPILAVEVLVVLDRYQAYRDFTAGELASGSGEMIFLVPAELGSEQKNPPAFDFRFHRLADADIAVTQWDLEPLVCRVQRQTPNKWRLLWRLRSREAANRHANGNVTVPRAAPASCMLDGPPSFYLGPGQYRLLLTAQATKPKRVAQAVLGVEVLSSSGEQFSWREFTAADLCHGPAPIDFVIHPWQTIHVGWPITISFNVYHLANADIAISAVELESVAAATSATISVKEWTLTNRVAWRRWFVRKHAATVRIGRSSLHADIRPRLKLPRGWYRLFTRGRAGTSSQPVLRISLLAKRYWRPPRGLRWLFDALRWRLTCTIGILGTAQFTARQLSDGAAFDLEVPPDCAIDAFPEVWFGVEFNPMAPAAIDIDEVRLTAIAKATANASELASAVTAPLTRHRSRANLVMIGNCQAYSLSRELYQEPFGDRFNSVYHYIVTPDHELEKYKRDINRADVILYQDIDKWENYRLKEEIRGTAQIIPFPCLRFASPWPFDGYNGPGDPEAVRQNWPHVKFPYVDGMLARLRREYRDPDARFDAYRALDFNLTINPARMHEFEQRRLLKMDERFKCTIGGFILENFQRRRIFHTTNHPNGELTAMLLRMLSERLGLNSVRRSGRQLDKYFNHTEVPVHPAIGKILGIAWAEEQARYAFAGEQITWETYVRRYISHFG
jgi:Polysaccharide biosynthesis enzyme WcbI